VTSPDDAALGLNRALLAVRLTTGDPDPADLEALADHVAECRAIDGDLPGDGPEELAMAEAVLAGRGDGAHLEHTRREFMDLAADGDIVPLLDDAMLDRLAGLLAGDEPAFEQGLATFKRAATARDAATLKSNVKKRRKKLAAAAADAPALRDDGLPVVVVTGQQPRHVSAEAKRVLEESNAPEPWLFLRAGRLARTAEVGTDRLTIADVDEAMLRHQLVERTNTVRRTPEGDKDQDPPRSLITDLHVRPDWQLPPLDAIVETPIIRPDGSVRTAPGYDRQSAAIYHPAPGLNVPDVPASPTPDQTAAALALLDDAIRDFPFAGPSARAAALALLLTPILRSAIPGPVPLALINAPSAGTGKSLLTNVVARIATGRAASMGPAPAREEEWEKDLFARLREAQQIIVFDNVHGTLKSASLDRAITASWFTSRILGGSETASLPQRATWIASGNNLKVGGDLARRSYVIGLDAKHATPWLRDDDKFRHPDLAGWVTDNRGRLIAAALTLARAWWAAGRPAAPSPILGSFEDWSTVVGGTLAHAGVDGFLTDLNAHYEKADTEAAEWESFLRTWHATVRDEPTTAGLIAQTIYTDETPDGLRATLPGDLGDYIERRSTFVRKLGRALSAHADRRHGDDEIRVTHAGTDRTKVALWRVVTTTADAGLQGSQGFPPATYGTDRATHANTTSPVGRAAANPQNPATLHGEAEG